MIKINDESWKVLLVPSGHPGLKNPNGTYTLGSCDDFLKIIFLDENLNNFYLKKVLLHELVHAYFYSNDIKIPNEHEEFFADIFATYGQEILKIAELIIQDLNQ